MRNLILERIEKMREYHRGFGKDNWRFRSVTIENVHISDIGTTVLEKLGDEALLYLLERLIRQSNKQG